MPDGPAVLTAPGKNRVKLEKLRPFNGMFSISFEVSVTPRLASLVFRIGDAAETSTVCVK